jgi:CubicO group peptidase (beta-lactamase class C family)
MDHHSRRFIMKQRIGILGKIVFVVAMGVLLSYFSCQRSISELLIGDWVEHGFSSEKRDSLQSFFQESIDKGDIPGGALLVIHQDEVIFKEAFGIYDSETGRSFTLDELCTIASVSKSISSTLMVILEERGFFSLDDPVEKWIPAFQNIKIREGAKPDQPPLLRQTLFHRSGLPGNADLEEGDPLIRGSLSEVADSLATYGLLAEPGTRYAYSEAGYKTAGRVAEVASGKSFEVLLKENLLDPLGMTHTTFHPVIEDINKWPRAYQREEGELRPLPADLIENFLNAGIDPGGSLFSTLDDMGRFLLFQLNRGKVNGKQLVSREALDQMLTSPEGQSGPPYGLGLALGSRGPGQARHLGGSGTFIWFDFEKDMAGFLLKQTRWRGNRPFQQKFMQIIQTTFEE